MSTLTIDATLGGSVSLVGPNTASTYVLTVPAKNGILFTANASTGGAYLAAGTTAQRPSSPVAGMIRYNTTTGVLEVYTGTAWQSAWA